MANTQVKPSTNLENASSHETQQGHAVAEESVLASLGLNGQLFTFQLINFTLVFLVVWFMILKPLTKKMEERKRLIDDSVDKARKIEDNLLTSQQKFQEKIDEAKVEANTLLQKAYAEAEAAGNKMKDKAKQEIETIITDARKKIEAEKNEMQAEIKRETVELVILTVEKLLGEKMDQKKDGQFIQDLLQKNK